APLVLLTESASFDPDIVAKIDAQLKRGGNVVITSGFLKAMQEKYPAGGFRHIAEWTDTGRKALIGDFMQGYGAGNGQNLNDAKPAPILFPEIRFWTNDSWGIIRGLAGAKGYPILLMNRYAKGIVYLWTMPENPADLYRLPQGVVTQVKAFLMPQTALRLESPAHVALFAYDNHAYVVESYRDTPVTVTLSLAEPGLVDAESGKTLAAETAPAVVPDPSRHGFQPPKRTLYRVTVPPHSWRVFKRAP
ncbi:MAG TPA: hypothetical protein VGC27_01870, partial [Rhizomicrobium sp.]